MTTGVDDEARFSEVWPNVFESLEVGEQPPGMGRPRPRL